MCYMAIMMRKAVHAVRATFGVTSVVRNVT